ncbi:GNAT family N-acetyltransferase [Halomonas sp. PAMB 3232]|uniref:GNAT family N-acetyltransferase n=1 Tax=Halomonas sp. PAMB 3232 TaxID=3075221 RepID=UPI002897BFCE|nr:GNAT family N-acetyltransferase [Halomonas sp. PAMB 3232]WNL38988.1 GNAT family N-acetyltransferase [Halomonas sp. PAMB 3232]
MPCHEAFDHYCVGACPFKQRREALLKLGAVTDPSCQADLQRALQRMKRAPKSDWQGLRVVKRGAHIETALWIEPMEGAIARLWLPGVQHACVGALLRDARQSVDEQGVALCHVALAAGDRHWEPVLVESAMERLATLWHLNVTLSTLPAMPETTPETLEVAPFDALNREQQLGLLQGVSDGSLDCPALLEALPIRTLLSGFYAGAPDAPRHWYRILHDGETAGVLLLAPQGPARWELQLMGLLPGLRGRGLGRALLERAMRLAFQAGARELCLTVDAQNAPAVRLYLDAGFERESEQWLYAWRQPS